MKVTFNPPPQRVWESYFQTQSVQYGRGATLLGGFKGKAFQRGAGLGAVLGSLFKTILPVAKKVGKSVGKEVLRTTAHVASDALAGRDLVESLEERGKAGAAKLLSKGVAKLDAKPTRRVATSTVRKRNNNKKRTGQKGRGALGFMGAGDATKKKRKRVGGLIRKKVKVEDQLGSYFA
jgi:hypothetical protein